MYACFSHSTVLIVLQLFWLAHMWSRADFKCQLLSYANFVLARYEVFAILNRAAMSEMGMGAYNRVCSWQDLLANHGLKRVA